jgi:hypothetical protein
VWLDLLAPYTFTQSGLQAGRRYRYSTQFQFTVTHALGFPAFTSRILATDLLLSNFNSHMKSFWHSQFPFFPFPAAVNSEDSTHFSSDYSSVLPATLLLSLSLMLRPAVSRSVSLGIKSPCGAYDQILTTVRQLRVLWCGAFSLTRGRVCRLQLLLALASAVILGSESRVIRDHILLSQIRDFTFCRSPGEHFL